MFLPGYRIKTPELFSNYGIDCDFDIRGFVTDEDNESGKVYISKKVDVYDLLDDGNIEKLRQRIAKVFGIIAIEVIMELVVPEHSSILGIEAKHDAHAQDIEPAQGLRRVVVVLLQQSIVNLTNNLTSLHRDLHFFRDMLASRVNEELEAVILLA